MISQPYVVPENLRQQRGTFTLCKIVVRMVCLLWLALGLELAVGAVGFALDWAPTDQEIQKYRHSWNPLSNGPIFISGVDVHQIGRAHV